MMTARNVSARALLLAALLALGGCESMDALDAWIRQNQDKVRLAAFGGLGGALAGGMIGGSQLAMGIGAGVGGVLGWNTAELIFPKDEAPLDDALKKGAAAPTGETIEWRNPETGSRGTVTPLDTARTTVDGTACRLVEAHVETEKGQATERRTVCRDKDGNWVQT